MFIIKIKPNSTLHLEKAHSQLSLNKMFRVSANLMKSGVQTLQNPTSVILPHVIFKMSLKMENSSNFCWIHFVSM